MGQGTSTPGGIIDSVLNNPNFNADKLKALLAAGHSVEEKCSKGRTALAYAISYNKLEAVRILVEVGNASYTNISSDMKNTAIYQAANNLHFEILRYLFTARPSSVNLVAPPDSKQDCPFIIPVKLRDSSQRTRDLSWIFVPAYFAAQYPSLHGAQPFVEPPRALIELLSPSVLGISVTGEAARYEMGQVVRSGMRCKTVHVAASDIPRFYKPRQPRGIPGGVAVASLATPEFPEAIRLPCEPPSQNEKKIDSHRTITITGDGRAFSFVEKKGIIFKEVVSECTIPFTADTWTFVDRHYLHVVMNGELEVLISAKTIEGALNLQVGFDLLLNAVVPQRRAYQRFVSHLVLLSSQLSHSQIFPLRKIREKLDESATRIIRVFDDEQAFLRESRHSEANAAFHVRSAETTTYLSLYSDAAKLLSKVPQYARLPPASVVTGPGGLPIIDAQSHAVIGSFLYGAENAMFMSDPIMIALRSDNNATKIQVHNQLREFDAILQYHTHPPQATGPHAHFHARMAISYRNFASYLQDISNQLDVLAQLVSSDETRASAGAGAGYTPDHAHAHAHAHSSSQHFQPMPGPGAGLGAGLGASSTTTNSVTTDGFETMEVDDFDMISIGHTQPPVIQESLAMTSSPPSLSQSPSYSSSSMTSSSPAGADVANSSYLGTTVGASLEHSQLQSQSQAQSQSHTGSVATSRRSSAHHSHALPPSDPAAKDTAVLPSYDSDFSIQPTGSEIVRNRDTAEHHTPDPDSAAKDVSVLPSYDEVEKSDQTNFNAPLYPQMPAPFVSQGHPQPQSQYQGQPQAQGHPQPQPQPQYQGQPQPQVQPPRPSRPERPVNLHTDSISLNSVLDYLGSGGRTGLQVSQPNLQPQSQPQQYPPQGYPPPGQGHMAYPPQQGYPPQGYPPQGYPPQGYPPQGQGYPPQGYSHQGYPPQGQGQTYPSQGYSHPQQGQAPSK